jgi:hypothetical protein
VLTAEASNLPAIGVQAMPVSKPAAARPVAKPVAVPADDDGLGALYALAEQERATSTVDESPRCPQCRSEMDKEAVLCTDCGYDTRTGKALSAAAVAPAAKSKAGVATLNYAGKPANPSAAEGSVLLGVATCAGFALAASLVWILIAWLTGYAIGYVAVLIGAAAGAGMKVGQKGGSDAGAFIAAGMTVIAILFAKLMVLELYIIHRGLNASIFNLDAGHLATYLFTPMSAVFITIGVLAAFRSAK